MAISSLSSLIPSVDELLNLDLARLGELLLLHLKSYEGQGHAVWQHGGLNRDYLIATLEGKGISHGLAPMAGAKAEYGTRQAEVRRAIVEAWDWLVGQGFLSRNPEQPSGAFFLISRAGETLLQRLARYEQWEKLGVDHVRNGLLNDPTRVIGGTPEVRKQAGEWLQMKDNKAYEKRLSVMTPVESATESQKLSRKVFIVHGHDNGTLQTVARFLERAGVEPIILHEQASGGRTIIEKLEANSDVGFAVVLLTPDDEGCKKGDAAQLRARQNVVLELGYFIGVLSRNRVCALRVGEVEIPSDFLGVVYVQFDSGQWKQALGKELEEAGFTIDWKNAIGNR
jgi:predicted nucleotide-binding protein